MFNEYLCLSSFSKFVGHSFIQLCLIHLFCLFRVQFIRVINLLIICVFLYALFMNVVVLVNFKVAVGNFGNVLVA